MLEVTRLLKTLKSWNLHTRTNAARKLKDFHDPQITPALCKALFDFPFRHWSRRTFGYRHVWMALFFASYEKIPLSLRVWEKTVASYRKAIIEALIAQNDTRAVKSLKRLLHEGYHDRKQTLTALTHFEGEEVWQILCDALIAKYGYVMDAAAELLYARDKIRAIKPLIEAFDFSLMESEWKPHTRQSKLIEILTRIGEPAFDDLIKALEHPNHSRRDGVAKTLKKLEDKRAIAALWQAKDNTPYALVALAYLDYENIVDTLIERLVTNVPRYGFAYLEHIIDILGEHREEKAVTILVSYLEGSEPKRGNPSHVSHIVIALKKIGTPQAESAIVGWPDFAPYPPFDWFEAN